jgi:hypothetical protein
VFDSRVEHRFVSADLLWGPHSPLSSNYEGSCLGPDLLLALAGQGSRWPLVPSLCPLPTVPEGNCCARSRLRQLSYGSLSVVLSPFPASGLQVLCTGIAAQGAASGC